MTTPDTSNLPILYVKTGCPWCSEVVEFLDEHGISYRHKNVTEDSGAFSEMERLSGQTKAPTMDWHGDVLSDFGVAELVPFLRKHNAKLEDN